MDYLLCEIARLKAAILEYDHALPCAEGPWRDQLLFHRAWDLRTLVGYQQQIARA